MRIALNRLALQAGITVPNCLLRFCRRLWSDTIGDATCQWSCSGKASDTAADGTRWTLSTSDPAATNATFDPLASTHPWSKSTTDFLGRTLLDERPAFGGGTLVTSNTYNTIGQLIATAQYHNPVNPVNPVENLSQILYVHDSLGQPLLSAQDVDFDGQVDLDSPDRVQGQSTSYEAIGADWWQVSRSWTYPQDGSATAITNAISRTRLTGLGATYGDLGVLTSESVSIDSRGNTTTSRTVIDRDGKTVYQITDVPDSITDSLATTVNGLPQASRSTHNQTTRQVFDALRRPVATQDARGAVRSRGYDSKGRVVWESDPATNGTWFAFDNVGRRIAVTNALGQVTHTAYDSEGRVIATWGATYPVAYEYSPQGRMVAMATTRDPDLAEVNLWDAVPNWPLLTANCPLDRTRWFYDEPTGLLTNKLYADGKGTAYSYTPDGQLASRTWARGVVTRYSYTNGSELASIDYSDATPDVTFQYDRLGRMLSAIVAGVSTNAYTYDPATLALSAEAQNGVELERITDTLGRDTGFALGPDYAVRYGFDAYGRFSSVSSSVASVSSVVQYSRLPNSDLISGMAASSGHSWTRSFEPARSLITSVENRFGETVISRYDYANDTLGRRVSRADSGTAFAAQPTYGDSATTAMPAYSAYAYNARSEVTGATRRWGTPATPGDLVLGQQYAYEFDPIGNRLTSAEGNTDRTMSYTANDLNQYSQRSLPDEKDLIGTAPTNVTVTVNEAPTSRQAAYWHHALEADNAAFAAYPQVKVTAVYNPPGTNDPDVVTSATGHVFVAQTPEQFTYDDDGSLTRDGRFVYAWNGENRLILAETRDDLPASVPHLNVEYAYDHRGRMVWKRVSTNDVVASTRTLLWDGYNIVRQTVTAQQDTSTQHFTWGLDLSGSIQGAGGVGGLLAEVRDGVPCFAAFDATGNVTEYLAADGDITAHYEYSPFGEIVVQSGAMADGFLHRFSTKPWCAVTGLSEYLFRKYGPGTGRWLSRDPIGEYGGIGLYCFLRNNGIACLDLLGMMANTTPDPLVCQQKFIPYLKRLLLELEEARQGTLFTSALTELKMEVGVLNSDLTQLARAMNSANMEMVGSFFQSLILNLQNPIVDYLADTALQATMENRMGDYLKRMSAHVGARGECARLAASLMETAVLAKATDDLQTRVSKIFAGIKAKCPCTVKPYANRMKKLDDHWLENVSVADSALEKARKIYDDKCSK